MRTLTIFLFCCLFAIVSCKQDTTVKDDKADTETTDKVEVKEKELTDFPESVSYENAAIKSIVYSDGTFNYSIDGDDYQLGVQTPDAGSKMCANSAKGQHIHLIMNNEPYSAHYESTFDKEIPDGEHYMLSFLSRSYHESIKTPTAYVAQKVMVNNNSIDPKKSEIIEQPMLFYSRPKGKYTGKQETEKVMLDFYLVNAELGENMHSVRVEVDGQVFEVSDWKPYYIENLGMGEHTVKLTLLNEDNQIVSAPHNPVERTFTLQENPAENAVPQ